jgi:hypothetical protein
MLFIEYQPLDNINSGIRVNELNLLSLTGALGIDSVALWKCKHVLRCVISSLI